MIELEEMSNKKIPSDDALIDSSSLLADAKCLIFAEMVLSSGQKYSEIAKNYIRKCLLSRSGDTNFVSKVIKGVSKLIKKDSLGFNFVEFVLELVKNANLDTLDQKIFQNLHQYLGIIALEKQSEETNEVKSMIKKVFQSQLNLYQFQKDTDLWLKYIHFLGSRKEEGGMADSNAAKREYERALIIIGDT